MATYNGETFVREQLESLASQSRLPDELIVGDDGSSDTTLEIIRSFAERAPFKTVILPSQGRLGYRANFLRCARHCTGDFIAFCDQDDIWLPYKLERQCEALSSPEVTLSSHSVRLIDANGRPLKQRFAFFERPMMASHADLPPFVFALGMTICMKRQCLLWDELWRSSLDCNITSEPMAHDQWYPLVASLIGLISFQEQPLVLYRQHGANVTGNRKRRTVRDKIVGTFQGRSSEYRALQISASNRSEIIGAMVQLQNEAGAATCPADSRINIGSLQQAKGNYARLADSLERRCAIVRSKSIPERIGKTLQSIRAADYRPRSKWHFRPLSVVRDFVDDGRTVIPRVK